MFVLGTLDFILLNIKKEKRWKTNKQTKTITIKSNICIGRGKPQTEIKLIFHYCY